ncbi:MAG: dehydratase [Actinomycetota bacterium]|nr:dehydratase [Actinomycetota bacterium]
MKLEPGNELPPLDHRVDALHVIMYAGASGDFNPLHWDPNFAVQSSPTGGVIAHGMYAMGLASRMLTSWAGSPDRVLEIQVRFTNPWPVGMAATFGGRVAEIEHGVATVELWGRRDDGGRILRGSARVRAG